MTKKLQTASFLQKSALNKWTSNLSTPGCSTSKEGFWAGQKLLWDNPLTSQSTVQCWIISCIFHLRSQRKGTGSLRSGKKKKSKIQGNDSTKNLWVQWPCKKSMKLAGDQAVDTQPWSPGCLQRCLFSGSPKSHMMWLSIAFSVLCGAVWGNSCPRRCSLFSRHKTHFSVAHIASHAVLRCLVKIVIISIPHQWISLQTHALLWWFWK